MVFDMDEKLYGFNNITKYLSISIYSFYDSNTEANRLRYLKSMNKRLSAECISQFMNNVVEVIGAHVLSVSKHNYSPLGSSATLMLSEEDELDTNENMIYHLDASHIATHTYPEFHPNVNVCSFRTDIEISTCGRITPLKALNYLLTIMPHELVTIDYRFRGFTRLMDGSKIYVDDAISSIKDTIPEDVLRDYDSVEMNHDIFDSYHLRLKKKSILSKNVHKEVTEILKKY